jgi:hypoxanthine-guanine phosphoribosyltransferase
MVWAPGSCTFQKALKTLAALWHTNVTVRHEFATGYDLDYNGQYRNLKQVPILNE